ncbi:MAG TPA: DUF5317 domain-containing protein [Anaerolineales bacterium]
MILVWAVIAGLIVGLARAIVGNRKYRIPQLRHLWLVIAAFIPQVFAFRLSGTRSVFPDAWVPVVLVGSQAVLLVFVMLNLRAPGFWVLGLGLASNLLVISLNHGLMPISPETVYRLLPADLPPGVWSVGERFGVGKDLVLPQGDTKLWFLSDIFLLPLSDISKVAFSAGDALIAIGVIWLLWSLGGPVKATKEQVR